MDTLSDPKEGRRRINSAHRLARLLLAAEKPMIAEVRGHAVGAGAGLALLCDTIVMGRGGQHRLSISACGARARFRHRLHVAQAHRVREGPAGLALRPELQGSMTPLAIGLADDVVRGRRHRGRWQCSAPKNRRAAVPGNGADEAHAGALRTMRAGCWTSRPRLSRFASRAGFPRRPRGVSREAKAHFDPASPEEHE